MSIRPGGELTGLVVVVTGATGAAGRAAVRGLALAGADVVAVGRDEHRLAGLFDRVDGVHPQVADVGDRAQCDALADRVRRRHHRIDGLVHLIGGWRGAPRFTANSDEDWAFLSRTLIDTLRYITMALHDDLAGSPDGRAVLVSAPAVDRPSPGGANYAAAKAAAQGWMAALAASFVRTAAQAAAAPHAHPTGTHAAATVLVVKALVDEAMRDAEPDRAFDGFTDVGELAARIVDLFTEDAADINGARILLTPTAPSDHPADAVLGRAGAGAAV
jgi:NADP-dependent 3-hydroxy acid dehydrogenase YdfG